jgi:hypothetical protein
MLFELTQDVFPRGENGETEIGGLVTRGTLVDGRFRKWVGKAKGKEKGGNEKGKEENLWNEEKFAWNALVISGPWAGAVMYFAAGALKLVNGQDESVRYGMVEAGNAISMKRCPHCGEPAALHVLKQDKDSWNSLLKLREVIAHAQKDRAYFRQAVPDAKLPMPKPRDTFMLGVLMTKNRKTWVAHSGEKDDPTIKAIVEKILHWDYAGMDKVKAPIMNKRGEEATDGRGPKSQLQTFAYQCAAPKLVQAAIKDDDAPFAMSEAFLDVEKDARPQPSCGRCASTVCYMLCPY